MARKIVQAQRDNLKARIAISAPSGSGKTSQALWLAEELADDGRILVIDTERGSAKLYSKPPGSDGEGTVFQHMDFQPPYAPLDLADEIDTNGGAYDVIIVDSLSHFWNGPGGILEIADRASNKIQGWRTATPMQDRMISSILNAPCHIICTTRAKVDTQLEKDNKGRLQVRTFGLKAVQREDVIYEFTIVLEVEKDSHASSVSKTRMREIDGHTFQTPGDVRALGRKVKAWLNVDNSEAIAAQQSMADATNEAMENAAQAAGDLTEEDAAADIISEDQFKSIVEIFQQIPEGPSLTAAKNQFKNAYPHLDKISAGRYNSAVEEANSIVNKALAELAA